MGRGTARSAVEGQTAPESPSTMLRMDDQVMIAPGNHQPCPGDRAA